MDLDLNISFTSCFRHTLLVHLAFIAQYQKVTKFQLKEDPAGYEPVFDTREDGAVTVAGWAVGFSIGSGYPLSD